LEYIGCFIYGVGAHLAGIVPGGFQYFRLF